MSTTYNYDKFSEWLTLRRYSPATVNTTVRLVEYFRVWAAGEGITEPEEISYSDIMQFMQWSSKHGASQKTIANYLTHVRKFYQFLISEGLITENPVAHIKVQGIKRKIYYDVLNTEALQQLYRQYPITIVYEAGKNIPPQEQNIISRKRNKVIVSLLIYQGLRVEEIAALELQDLTLQEGKIRIHSQRRTAAREMKLESHQVFELLDYVQQTRKEFLKDGATTPKLFVQRDNGKYFYSVTQSILVQLRKINGRIKNLDQIRASVITEWLKQYDLRKVQYLAGHKYVSSTERYKSNMIDGLQEEVSKYHPF